MVLAGLTPDLTFVLDLPAEAGLARAEARRLRELAPQSITPERDLFEDRDLGFHQRLRAGFREIARTEPSRCVLVDALRPAQVIAADIAAAIETRWGSL